jgi:hypothetical protein
MNSYTMIAFLLGVTMTSFTAMLLVLNNVGSRNHISTGPDIDGTRPNSGALAVLLFVILLVVLGYGWMLSQSPGT